MVALLRVLHFETQCQQLSCCYRDSTVTLTKCEITQWSGFLFQKATDKDVAVSSYRKVIYSLSTPRGP